MANELRDAVLKLQTIAGALDGVRSAPDYPPGTAPQGIFAIAVPSAGSVGGISAGWRTARHVVLVHIVKALQDLPRDVEALLPIGDTFVNELVKDPTIGATCQTINDEVTYSFGQNVSYNGIDYIGWTFSIPLRQTPVVS